MNPVPRYALRIVVRKDEKTVDTGLEFTAPTSQAMPNVGDELQMPQATADQHNLRSTALKVVKRQFLIGQLPVGFTGVAFLVCVEVG
jgi:hypothetical protein